MEAPWKPRDPNRPMREKGVVFGFQDLRILNHNRNSGAFEAIQRGLANRMFSPCSGCAHIPNLGVAGSNPAGVASNIIDLARARHRLKQLGAIWGQSDARRLGARPV